MAKDAAVALAVMREVKEMDLMEQIDAVFAPVVKSVCDKLSNGLVSYKGLDKDGNPIPVDSQTGEELVGLERTIAMLAMLKYFRMA